MNVNAMRRRATHVRPLASLLATLLLVLVVGAPRDSYAQATAQVRVVSAVATPGDGAADLAIDFEVIGADGVPIDGAQALGGGTVEIIEPQRRAAQPLTFGPPPAPLAVYLLIDISSSMTSALPDVVEAAKIAIAAAPTGTTFTVATFSHFDLAKPPQPLLTAGSSAEAVAAVGKIVVDPTGPTCLYNAAYHALSVLRAQAPRPEAPRALILFTDGKDYDGLKGPCSQKTESEVIAAAHAGASTPIYTVGMCSAKYGCAKLDQVALASLADKTGGAAFASAQTQIGDAFGGVMARLRGRRTAHARIFPAQGQNKGLLHIRDGQGGEIVAPLEFSSPQAFSDVPEISGTPRYDPSEDRYVLPLTIKNAAGVASIAVETVQSDGTRQLSVRSDKPRLLSAEEQTAGTLQYVIPAAGAAPGESLIAGQEYCFRVRAFDQAGQAITRPLDDRNVSSDTDPQTTNVLHEICAPAYTPELNPSLGEPVVSDDRRSLHVPLTLVGAGSRAFTVGGEIVDDGRTIKSYEWRSLDDLRGLSLELPEELHALGEEKRFTLVLRLRDATRTYPAGEVLFLVPPAPHINWWPAIGLGAAVLAVAALAAFLLLRRMRSEEALQPPSPLYGVAPAAGRSPLTVRVIKTPQVNQQRAVPVEQFPFTIGRRDASLAIEGDGGISRCHIEIQRSGEGQITVIDKHSRNGTFAEGGQRINGPLLIVGRTELQLGSETRIAIEPQ